MRRLRRGCWSMWRGKVFLRPRRRQCNQRTAPKPSPKGKGDRRRRRWWKRHSTKLQVSSAPMRKGTTRLPYSPKRFLYFHSLPLLFRLASLATFPKGEGFCCLLYISLPTKPEAVRLPRGGFLPFGDFLRSLGERGIEPPLPFGRSFVPFWRVRKGPADRQREVVANIIKSIGKYVPTSTNPCTQNLNRAAGTPYFFTLHS